MQFTHMSTQALVFFKSLPTLNTLVTSLCNSHFTILHSYHLLIYIDSY